MVFRFPSLRCWYFVSMDPITLKLKDYLRNDAAHVVFPILVRRVFWQENEVRPGTDSGHERKPAC